jgi:hypothetical protein
MIRDSMVFASWSSDRPGASVSHGTGVAAEQGAGAGFEVAFVDRDGGERRMALSQCWTVRFEQVPPVRGFASFPGQSHFPGLWWFSSSGGHVGFESWLERDVVMSLDADPLVTAVASQPFWLSWPDGERLVRHAPDFFVRHRDGSAVVIDVRADDRIEDSDAAKFAATARACAQAGWQYRRIGALDPVLAANLRWLAGYRHPRFARSEFAEDLIGVFTRPRALGDGALAVGDPLAVLPALFNLLWRKVLLADIESVLLTSRSVVRAAGDER